jgi:hypothetical protein
MGNISILPPLGGIKIIMVRARSFLLRYVYSRAAGRAQDRSQPITLSVMSSAYGEKLKIRGIPNGG